MIIKLNSSLLYYSKRTVKSTQLKGGDEYKTPSLALQGRAAMGSKAISEHKNGTQDSRRPEAGKAKKKVRSLELAGKTKPRHG